MPQFDVYRNPNPNTNKDIPFLLDVQTELLNGLATRVVVPLVAADVMGAKASILNPEFTIAGQRVAMSTAELAGVSRRDLGEKVTSLAHDRHIIIGALDFLVSGF